MPQIDLSVVIVNYNVKDFLARSIRSIHKASKNLNVEIIVVDNNSRDGSREELPKLFHDVKFILNSQNIGFGAANNQGIFASKGKYILILNPDTIVDENNFHTMINFMENNPDTGIAGCKVLNADGSFQAACRRGFPTPWTAFSRLFGLQKLFPSSKLFGGYNQTHKPIDETYQIDAIIGAYMFCRAATLKEIGGFDTDYFMYGEDIDLCLRMKNRGFKVMYVHSATIIHFKGESTKRSSIDEIRHFYDAMVIYTGKHVKGGRALLTFLRFGIILRSILARFEKYSADFGFMLADILIIEFSLLIGTFIKYNDIFGFPEYAYPLIFIITPLICIISLISVGEYFENKRSIPGVVFGLLVAFFGLSTLIYFFNEYAFSRMVLTYTIFQSMAISSLLRLGITVKETIHGRNTARRVLFIGNRTSAVTLMHELNEKNPGKLVIVGYIDNQSQISIPTEDHSIEYLGDINSLSNVIINFNLSDVVITDRTLPLEHIIKIITSGKNMVNYHIVNQYEEFVVSEIINQLEFDDELLPKYNISLFRYRLMKRLIDIIVSCLAIILLIPFLFFPKIKRYFKELFEVFSGRKSLVGTFAKSGTYDFGKEGLISLAGIGKNTSLLTEAVKKLDEYYLQNYSLLFDLEIFIKYLMRNPGGN